MAPAPAPAPYGSGFAPATAPYGGGFAPAPATAAVGNLTGTTAMVVGAPAPASAAPAPSGPGLPTDQLMAMGFSLLDANAALAATQGDLYRATDWLLQGHRAAPGAVPAPVPAPAPVPVPAPVPAPAPAPASSFATAMQPTIVGVGPVDPAVRFAHIAPDGSRHEYSASDNQVIAAARARGEMAVRLKDVRSGSQVLRFEMRLGEPVKERGYPTGMIQINCDTGNIRMVEQISGAGAALAPAPAPPPVPVPAPAPSQPAPVVAAFPDALVANELASAALPPGWEQRMHDGKPYYVNHDTRTTTWDRPVAPVPAPAVASMEAQRRAEEARAAAAASNALAAAAAEQERQRAAAEQRARLEVEREEQRRVAEAQRMQQERIAAEQAEQMRMAAERAEQERIAAEQAEQECIAAEQAEQARLAAEQAEQERIAAEQAEQARLAAALVGGLAGVVRAWCVGGWPELHIADNSRCALRAAP